jgi:Zn-dependent protease
LFDLTLQQIGLRLCALVVIAVVHGAAVAGTACALGDQGPRLDGRLTLNPFAHLDIVGTVSGVLFSIAWIKPITVDPGALRLGRLGLALVVVAGLTATLVSAVLLRLLRPAILPLLSNTASEVVFALIETFAQLSLWFVLVNVLPVPTLTGEHWLTALAPRWRKRLVGMRLYAAIALFILAGAGLLGDLLTNAYEALARHLPGS